ncbi:DUF4302 domain-containing protein [Pinibacter soli]|uniref:DUF4302 domain-containing protein n=1 Tax=Pinibacter soli TaxID=3044211 RepID=A0ABT6RH32_9BACT|nr:DUF4302 domain-containing protein [Pinibacter soli]MDI3321881.1 DUF4302 domain-containing protein [Pinibacter soli]
MKKILLYLFVVAAVLSSCQKEEKSVFNQTPDERINAALAQWQTNILSSANGWKALYHTGTGQDFNFYFTFNNQNRVVMYSDFDTSTTSARESSYRIKALQQPALIFDTYSYLHLLSDPNPYVNGGDAGVGLQADFEFAFDTMVGDTIKLKGRQNGTTLNLIKASKQEADDWIKGNWKNALSMMHIGEFLTYFKRSSVGGTNVDVDYDHYGRQIAFYTYNTSGIRTLNVSSFVYNPQGIVLTTPLKVGTTTVSTMTNMSWDATGKKINFSLNGTSPSTIAENAVPVVVNKNGATNWWLYKIQQGYWANLGFHQNGVEDAFNLQASIPGFYYCAYLPAYDTITKTTYWDWMAYAAVSNNSLIVPTSSSFVPTFTSDGKAIFKTYKPDPTNAPVYVKQTTAALTEPQGFYFIQISSTTIDMVGVKDAKTWVRWYWVQ